MIKIKIPYGEWFTVLLVAFCLTNSYGQNTHINISGIRSEKGQIVLNVFKNNEDYEQEKVYKKFVFEKKKFENGIMTIACDLEQGTYGITLIDDENKNGALNKNLIGIPKEGFGFSNFFMEKLKKPAFSDFKLAVKPQNNKVTIKVKYM